MILIEFNRPTGPSGPHALTELWRTDRRERVDGIRFVFWDYDTHAMHWCWNYPGEYGASDSRTDMAMNWAYVFSFNDGSRGVCRIRDLRAALAELGCEIDERGD